MLPGQTFNQLHPCTHAAKARTDGLDGSAWWALLVNALFHTQRGVFMQGLLCGWLFLTLMFLDPIILRELLDSASASDSPPPAPVEHGTAMQEAPGGSATGSC